MQGSDVLFIGGNFCATCPICPESMYTCKVRSDTMLVPASYKGSEPRLDDSVGSTALTIITDLHIPTRTNPSLRVPNIKFFYQSTEMICFPFH